MIRERSAAHAACDQENRGVLILPTHVVQHRRQTHLPHCVPAIAISIMCGSIVGLFIYCPPQSPTGNQASGESLIDADELLPAYEFAPRGGDRRTLDTERVPLIALDSDPAYVLSKVEAAMMHLPVPDPSAARASSDQLQEQKLIDGNRWAESQLHFVHPMHRKHGHRQIRSHAK